MHDAQGRRTRPCPGLERQNKRDFPRNLRDFRPCLSNAAERSLEVVADKGGGQMEASQYETVPVHRSPLPPPRSVGAARRDWTDLATVPDLGTPFDPEMTRHLPEPARRWLQHAIRPGTPLSPAVWLRTHGRIRLGSWRSFRATQILRPPHGFIWAADARVAGLPVSGFDRFSGGDGEMRWRVLGMVPVMSASGPDITRSAAGRLASEFVFVPAVALSSAVTWEPVGDHRARADLTVDGTTHSVVLSVSPEGSLTELTLDRWGAPEGGAFDQHVFGARFGGEASYGGYTVPAMVRAGWWYGTGRWGRGEFIRFTLDQAEFL
ncbi:DUF6544 family protein [Actinomadura nitritigenes]|uniref:DUF6544 family protein n=1 Tax=Actinomadura nitritigenes TaxID=134602 RepID=UPI003D8DAB03